MCTSLVRTLANYPRMTLDDAIAERFAEIKACDDHVTMVLKEGHRPDLDDTADYEMPVLPEKKP